MLINITQHAATQEQLDAGVVEPGPNLKQVVREALTFNDLPTQVTMDQRACWLADKARRVGATQALIGGAPFFMSTLEWALKEAGIEPVYAFSRRESVEEVAADGSVVKRNVFRHLGFVEVE